MRTGPGATVPPTNEPRGPRPANGKLPKPPTSSADLTSAVDWALAQNADPKSPYFGKIDPAAVDRLSGPEARRRGAIPIRVLEDDRLLVGVADPTDVGACDELRALLGGKVSLVVVDQVELHRTLAREYS